MKKNKWADEKYLIEFHRIHSSRRITIEIFSDDCYCIHYHADHDTNELDEMKLFFRRGRAHNTEGPAMINYGTGITVWFVDGIRTETHEQFKLECRKWKAHRSKLGKMMFFDE